MAKLYYSIKEVSGLIDEEQYLLRYWEKEFSILKPRKNKAGHRTYSPKDLLICKYLKHLIRDEKLSAKDVKSVLKSKSIAEILGNNNIDNVVKDKLRESQEADLLDDKDDKKTSVEDKGEDVFEKSEAEVNTDNEIRSKQQTEKIEKLGTLAQTQRKILLKDHLFEDFEEFSFIITPQADEKSREQKYNKSVDESVDILDINSLAKNVNEVVPKEYVLIKKEDLRSLINILKEIHTLL